MLQGRICVFCVAFAPAATMYAIGQGVKEDDVQSIDRYATGVGVPHDDSQAVYWWKKAVETGKLEFRTEANLAESYDLGRGIEQDYSRASYKRSTAASGSRLSS
jgi:TPR repeat protein